MLTLMVKRGDCDSPDTVRIRGTPKRRVSLIGKIKGYDPFDKSSSLLHASIAPLAYANWYSYKS